MSSISRCSSDGQCLINQMRSGSVTGWDSQLEDERIKRVHCKLRLLIQRLPIDGEILLATMARYHGISNLFGWGKPRRSPHMDLYTGFPFLVIEGSGPNKVTCCWGIGCSKVFGLMQSLLLVRPMTSAQTSNLEVPTFSHFSANNQLMMATMTYSFKFNERIPKSHLIHTVGLFMSPSQESPSKICSWWSTLAESQSYGGEPWSWTIRADFSCLPFKLTNLEREIDMGPFFRRGAPWRVACSSAVVDENAKRILLFVKIIISN